MNLYCNGLGSPDTREAVGASDRRGVDLNFERRRAELRIVIYQPCVGSLPLSDRLWQIQGCVLQGIDFNELLVERFSRGSNEVHCLELTGAQVGDTFNTAARLSEKFHALAH